MNSRLDEMQAAILRARLPLLPALDGAAPRARGRTIARALAGVDTVVVPPEADAGHVYHLFPVRSGARDAMQAHLTARGIETLIHYPVPIPRQPALATERAGRLPGREPRLCARCSRCRSTPPCPTRRSPRSPARSPAGLPPPSAVMNGTRSDSVQPESPKGQP